MEENTSAQPAPISEKTSEAPKEAASAPKKSRKLLYAVIIIILIIVAIFALIGVMAKKGYDSLDPKLKEGVGKAYECAKKCEELPDNEQKACSEKCVAESGLEEYISGVPTQAADSGSVSSSGVYSNSDFSFTPPSGWTQGSQQGVLVAFTNPKAPQNSINIVSESAPDFTLSEYVDVAKEQLSQAIPGYKVSNEKSVTINGIPAYQMDGAFTQEGISLVNRQIIIVNDGKVYVLTATSTPDAWTAYTPVIDSSFKTFKLN